MQLSLRLSAIADLVTEGNRLVDVGCDHGYLPVYLIQQKKIPSAIAMDVRKGPLSRAQEHIRQYGLEEYIQTRLSDGLEGLKAGEGDTLVIAGKILEKFHLADHNRDHQRHCTSARNDQKLLIGRGNIQPAQHYKSNA